VHGQALTALICAVFAAGSPTFSKNVAPILYARCVSCHQPGGDAPFSLITYDEVRRHARLIADLTAKRVMPPWKPAPDSPRFVGERRLTDAEIATIREWVDGGAPEGARNDSPPPPRVAANGGWPWGEPDLVLQLPTYTLRADGADVFRNFVVPVPGNRTRYVRGLAFRPRSSAVHHANIRIDPTPASRALDAADPAPGYEGEILHSADFPDGHFLGWTPGQAPPPNDELAWTLDAGSDLVVQLHLRPTGREESIAPLVGVYFTNSPPARRPAIVRLGRQDLDIPAGASSYQVSDTFVLPVDAQVVAVQPHAHYRARDVIATAALPDGSRRTLLHITDWDFNWQDQYRLAAPLSLPAGTTLAMTFTFDNSAANARNPSRPPERAQWGWRSSDEMADVWIQVMTRTERDRTAFTTAARRKMTREDAVGSEVLIARTPDYVALRNDAALIYKELGQFDRALVHFAAVTRLQPQSAAAHYNEGVVLEALGREPEAAEQYATALRLDPSYALAHNATANLHYRAGRIDEAIGEYRAAVAADPSFAIAHCSLARALTQTGRPGEAAREYQAALAAEPDSTACLVNFAWLLAAHQDAAVRRPLEAIALAERAVMLTDRQSADALDALGAAYASAGRFDEAVSVGVEAGALLDGFGQRQAVDDIRRRVDLYRRRLPFVIPDRE
jgi:tetratricopeptide (TPR) repeat protein